MTTATRGIALGKDGIWTERSPGAGGLRVTCVTGCLWLTVEGEERDRVLAAGEGFRTVGPGRVVVQALEAGRMEVVRDRAGKAPGRRLAALREALGGAAARCAQRVTLWPARSS